MASGKTLAGLALDRIYGLNFAELAFLPAEVEAEQRKYSGGDISATLLNWDIPSIEVSLDPIRDFTASVGEKLGIGEVEGYSVLVPAYVAGEGNFGVNDALFSAVETAARALWGEAERTGVHAVGIGGSASFSIGLFLEGKGEDGYKALTVFFGEERAITQEEAVTIADAIYETAYNPTQEEAVAFATGVVGRNLGELKNLGEDGAGIYEGLPVRKERGKFVVEKVEWAEARYISVVEQGRNLAATVVSGASQPRSPESPVD